MLAWLGQGEEQGEGYDEEEGWHDADEREREDEYVEDHPDYVTERHGPEQGRVQVAV
jgi:hypothetical protein